MSKYLQESYDEALKEIEQLKQERDIWKSNADTCLNLRREELEKYLNVRNKLEIAQKALEKVDMNLMAIDEKDNLGMRVKSDTFNLIKVTLDQLKE